MKWRAQAPSNIALIKYMGKTAARQNIPANASLSYTLTNLISTVELELCADTEDTWCPLVEAAAGSFPVLLLPEQHRFLGHLSFLKKQLNMTDKFFIVRSENNFPAQCGLASSASSFAALTLCATEAAATINNHQIKLTQAEIAAMGRHGSGSSCRSFFSPWALWRGESVQAINLPYANLLHHVIVISQAKKNVSSSEAHHLATTSALFATRPQRAEQRLQQLLEKLTRQDWQAAYVIVWQEFWDMLSLFETSEQPFSYLLPDSIAVLNQLRKFWRENGDGPLVTMDAGPNIHLLFREDQHALAQMLTKDLARNFRII